MTPRSADDAGLGDAVAGIRAFIAIELDAAVRRVVAADVQSLRAALADARVRWVRPENLHVTLRFLGQTDPARIPAITLQLLSAVAACPPFRLELSAVGWFPSARRPRALACAVGPSEPLARLAQAVEAAVTRAGCEPAPRRFRAHLTLGRITGKLRRPVTAAVTRAGESCLVNEIVLFRSELTRSGARYTPLERVAFGGSDHP